MLHIRQNQAVLEGDLNRNTVAKLLVLGNQYILGVPHAHFDLQAVTNCDSAGVALLVAWWRFANQHHKTINFSYMPAQAKSLLKVCMLETMLPYKEDLGSAAT